MQPSKKQKLLPLFGAGIFIFTILVLIFVATPLQASFKMTGLLFTELIILAIALLSVILLRLPFKEVFPIRKITARHFFGSFLFYIGIYLSVIIASMIMLIFFPALSEVGEYIGDFIKSVPFFNAVLLSAAAPAVCEEALFRGAILSTYKNNIKRRWVVILISGLLFGIFHLDPSRILATGILGGAFTYVFLKTGNILLPIILHFFNNLFSVSPMFLLKELPEPAAEEVLSPLNTVGTAISLFSFVPLLLMAGSSLLGDKGEMKNKAGRKRLWVSATVLSVACAFFGFYLLMVSSPITL